MKSRILDFIELPLPTNFIRVKRGPKQEEFANTGQIPIHQLTDNEIRELYRRMATAQIKRRPKCDK